MAWQGFGRRQTPSSRGARAGVFKGINVDSSDFDPEMAKTMASEGARRLGAAGVQMGGRGSTEGIKYAATPGEVGKSVAKWLGGLGKPRKK